MRKLSLAVLIISIISIYSCKKAKDECTQSPGYAVAPAIQLTNVLFNIDTFVYYGKLDTFTLTFTDGDKDLIAGTGDDSSTCAVTAYHYPPQTIYDSCILNDPTRNLFLVDERDSSMLGFQVNSTVGSTLTATGISKCGYDGTITFPVQIYDHKCGQGGTGPQCMDTVKYKIFMRDKAGHFSNVVETPSIIIIPTL